ncbi:MAG: hypothetical protein JWN64_509 [Parcubacteria group bacterium]|nr:hypothetical protein [Parcubacteria group bacterium]
MKPEGMMERGPKVLEPWEDFEYQGPFNIEVVDPEAKPARTWRRDSSNPHILVFPRGRLSGPYIKSSKGTPNYSKDSIQAVRMIVDGTSVDMMIDNVKAIRDDAGALIWTNPQHYTLLPGDRRRL